VTNWKSKSGRSI